MNHLKKILFGLAVVVTLGLVGGSSALACIVSANPATIRSEGTSELLGTINVNCTLGPVAIAGVAGGLGTTDGAPATAVVAIPSTITVSIAGGSVAIGAGNSFSAASGPGCGSTVDRVTKFPCPTIFTSGAGAYAPVPGLAPNSAATGYGSGVASAAGFGGVGSLVVSTGGSTVIFAFTPNPGAQVFTITGIRVNASAFAGSILTATVTVGGGLTQTGSTLTNVANVIGTLSGKSSGFSTVTGFVANSLGTQLAIASCGPPTGVPAGTPSTVTRNPDIPTGGLATLAVTLSSGGLNGAGFDVPWKASPANGGTEDTIPNLATPLGAFLPAAGNPTGADLAAGMAGGAATSLAGGGPFGIGTRFLVRLTGVPTGIVVYAPRNLGVSAAQLVSTGTGAIANGVVITRVSGADPVDGSGGAVTAALTSGSTRDTFDLITANADSSVSIEYEVTTQMVAGAAAASVVQINLVLTGNAPTGVGAIGGAFGVVAGTPPNNPAEPTFAGVGKSSTVATVNACASYLVFPWIAETGDGNYDTGLAIANTSSDPPGPAPGGIGTASQKGDVTLFFFPSDGSASFSQKIATALVGGATTTFVVSSLKKPFLGYIVAVCGFSYGHGFAFIDNPIGGQNGFAQGYLALSVGNPRTLLVTGVTAVESSAH